MFSKHNRYAQRGAAAAGLALATALALSGCAGAGDDGGGGGGGGDALQIGFVHSLTGANAQAGQQALQGAELAVAQINEDGGVDGQEVELVVKDDTGDPAVGVQQLRALSDDGINLVVAGYLAPICEAEIGQLERLNMVMMSAHCISDTLTGEGVSPNFFRVSDASYILSGALGAGLCDVVPEVERIDSIILDSASPIQGTDTVNRVTNEKCGVEAGPIVKIPTSATDVQSQVQSTMQNRAPDSQEHSVLQVNTFGPSLPQVLKEGEAIDLFGQYLATITWVSSWASAVEQVGSAPLTYTVQAYHYQAFDTDIAKRFEEEFVQAHGTQPGTEEAVGFRDVSALLAGVAAAESTSTEDVVKALAGLTFDDFSGPITIDPDTHQAAIPMVFLKYEGTDVAVVKILAYDQIASD